MSDLAAERGDGAIAAVDGAGEVRGLPTQMRGGGLWDRTLPGRLVGSTRWRRWRRRGGGDVPRLEEGLGRRGEPQGAVAPVWVTVTAPADAKSGEYTGNLTITCGGGEAGGGAAGGDGVPVEVAGPEGVRDVRGGGGVAGVGGDGVRRAAVERGALQAAGEVADAAGGGRQQDVLHSADMRHEHGQRRVDGEMDQAGGRELQAGLQRDGQVSGRGGEVPGEADGGVLVCVGLLPGGRAGGLAASDVAGSATGADRQAHQGKGPIVTMVDPATGKVEKGVLPMYSDPKSRELWGPVMKEIRERMKKRGLEKTAQLGIMTDVHPTKAVIAHFVDVSPGLVWVYHGHERFLEKIPCRGSWVTRAWWRHGAGRSSWWIRASIDCMAGGRREWWRTTRGSSTTSSARRRGGSWGR